MTSQELVKGRNYSVVVPAMSPLNHAYVGADKHGNHLFTRPSALRNPDGMRVISVKPAEIIEIREHEVRVKNYLLDCCEEATSLRKFRKLSGIWEASQK